MPLQVHCGHGYLLAQFLSPHTNRRRDEYGTRCADDRVRFPLAVCAAVREAVGDAVPITVKLNMDDGFAGGIRLEDCIQFAQARRYGAR